MSTDPKDIIVNWDNTGKTPTPVPSTDASNMITYLTEGADLSKMQTASPSVNKLIGHENFTKNKEK